MIGLVSPLKGVPVHSNVSVDDSAAVKIVSANRNRKSLVIQNTGGQTVYIGDSSVTNSDEGRGYAVFAGTTFVDNATDTEWWAVAASSTNVLHVIEIT